MSKWAKFCYGNEVCSILTIYVCKHTHDDHTINLITCININSKTHFIIDEDGKFINVMSIIKFDQSNLCQSIIDESYQYDLYIVHKVDVAYSIHVTSTCMYIHTVAHTWMYVDIDMAYVQDMADPGILEIPRSRHIEDQSATLRLPSDT